MSSRAVSLLLSPLALSLVLGAADPEAVPQDRLEQLVDQTLEEWHAARLDWEAELASAPAGSVTGAALRPEELFARRFEVLAGRGSGRAALWVARNFRGTLGLGPGDGPANGHGNGDGLGEKARHRLLAAYQRIVDRHADEAELLVPALFDALRDEGDLTAGEVDGLCDELEQRSRHLEVRARALLVRGLRAAPLGTADSGAQAAALALFGRVVTDYPPTGAAALAGEARWVVENLSVGRQPPDFTTHDLAGNEIRLADLRDRVVLVHFPGGEATAADEAIRMAVRLRRAFWDAPLTCIVIHEHADAGALRALMSEPDVLGTHAWEGGDAHPAVEAWRVPRRPITFLLDAKGRVRALDPAPDELSDRVHELVDETGPPRGGDPRQGK